ncbi:hypothetical protein PMIN03_008328 [Paraphaeosphaeria minitans]
MAPLVWLITGCSSGLGFHLAAHVLARGDIAIATLRNPSKLPAGLRDRPNAANLYVIQLDITAPQSTISAVVAQAAALHGRIDVLINNAGYIQIGTVEGLEHDWVAQFETNVFGAVKMTSAVLKGMRERGSGTVVFVGSLSGWVGHDTCGAYAGSKFALAGIAEALQRETSHQGIRTLLIEPGRFRTNLLSSGNMKMQGQLDNPAYSSMLDEKIKSLAKEDQAQPGDPAKFVRVVVDLVKGEGVASDKSVPLRMPIGLDCYEDVKQRCEKTLGQLKEWEEVMTLATSELRLRRWRGLCSFIPSWPAWLDTFTVASFTDRFADLKKSVNFLLHHPYLGTTAAPASQHPQPTDILSRLVYIAREGSLSDVIDLFTHPRFDDPAYLTLLSILLAAVFLAMSWFSRGTGSSGWGGRFSPFGRSSPNTGEVSDSDYSYITSADLKKEEGRNRSSSRPEIVDWDDKDPNRATDILVFKKDGTKYPTHFAAQSIRDGDLRISTVRQAAAKKLGVDDPRRIRLFYKGKNLKHDERTAREEGLRGDGSGSEILCSVGETATGSLAPGAEPSSPRAWSEGEDEEDTSGIDSGVNTSGKKKNRKRGGRKSKKKGAPMSDSSTPGLAYSNAGPVAGAEYLPIPSNIPGPRPTSKSAPVSGAATPQTPMGKLDVLASKFHTEYVPLCVKYMQNPPEETSKRQFEYKKLSETIMTQILLKLDGVEVEGDQDARMRRKELVREVQGMLSKLDEINRV